MSSNSSLTREFESLNLPPEWLVLFQARMSEGAIRAVLKKAKDLGWRINGIYMALCMNAGNEDLQEGISGDDYKLPPGIAERLEQGRIPTAFEAWGMVMEEMLRVGASGKPEFPHPIFDKVIRTLGGWKTLCMSNYRAADRAHFLTGYRELAGVERLKS